MRDMEVALAQSSTESLSTSQASISRPTSRPASKHGTRQAPGSAGSSRPTSAGISAVPPEYLRPIVKTAVRRWKRFHELKQFEKLLAEKEERRQKDRATREQVAQLARKIPVDILAREWLNTERATVETRAFLIENVLPNTILGLEKLLVEVMRRDLANKEEIDANFNPINFIAQYLMRNNPRYSNFSEASPYMRGMREVAESLRQEIFQFNDNKLAKLKAEARRRREERDREEIARQNESVRRKEAIEKLFDEFVIGEEVKVDQVTVMSAVKSFVEIVERLPEELRDKLTIFFEIEVAADSGKKFSRREFSDIITGYSEKMCCEIFDQFMNHLIKCARTFKEAAQKEARTKYLSSLFVTCDIDQIGLLDRPRILALLEKFYDDASDNVKDLLRNPREWPIREIRDKVSEYISEEEAMGNPLEKYEEAGLLHSPVEDVVRDVNQANNSNAVELASEVLSGDSGSDTKETALEDAKLEDEEKEDVDEKDESAEKTLEFEEEKEELVGEKPTEEDIVITEEVDADRKSDVASDDKKSDKGDEGVTEKEAVETAVIPEPQSDDKEETSEIVSEEVKETEKDSDTETKVLEDSAEKETVDKDKEDQSKESSSEKGDEKEKESSSEKDDEKEKESSSEKDDDKEKEAQKNVKEMEEADLDRSGTNVSFAPDTTFVRDTTGLSVQSMDTMRSQSSAFDEKTVTEPQFIHVIENFLSDDRWQSQLDNIGLFIKDNYVETEEERMQRLKKAHELALAERRKRLMDALFELWDNEGSGYIEHDEVEMAVMKFKGGAYRKGVASAKRRHRQQSRVPDLRLTKREFRDYLYAAVRSLQRENELEELIDFLVQNVARTHAERIRSEARRKFLHQIILAAYSSGATLDPVYRAVFQTLYKDAEVHGEGKHISANLAMLQGNALAPSRGPMMLRYVAATLDDSPFMIGQTLYKDMLNISFGAIESGKPVQVPRLAAASDVYFWNKSRKSENREGACVVVPLKDQRKRVFGTLGVDTLNDHHANIFLNHEIKFYEGVSKAFSIAYHYVDNQKKTLRIGESALAWLCRRVGPVHNVTYYMRERNSQPRFRDDFVLRKMVYINERGDITRFATPPRMERKDNLFRNYLFKVIDTSESLMEDAYGERHLAIPLRDAEGLAVAVIDIGLDANCRELPPDDNKEALKILNIFQMAYLEVLRSAQDEEDSSHVDSDSPSSAEVLFNNMMLADLRLNVLNLDPQAYAEMRSYQEPPKTVHNILQAVLALFYPQKSREGEFADWNKCKKYVSLDLSKKVMEYNPTTGALSAPVELITKLLADVPHKLVEKHGSKPAQHLFDWVFICFTLIEHTLKMSENRPPGLPSVPEEDPSEADKMDDLLDVSAQPAQPAPTEEQEKEEETPAQDESV